MNTQDVVKHKFSRAFRGYDIAEVDVFLDALIEDMEAREAAHAALLREVEALRATLVQYESAQPAAYGEAVCEEIMEFGHAPEGENK